MCLWLGAVELMGAVTGNGRIQLPYCLKSESASWLGARLLERSRVPFAAPAGLLGFSFWPFVQWQDSGLWIR
jgi:hypothetical protein